MPLTTGRCLCVRLTVPNGMYETSMHPLTRGWQLEHMLMFLSQLPEGKLKESLSNSAIELRKLDQLSTKVMITDERRFSLSLHGSSPSTELIHRPKIRFPYPRWFQ